MCLRCEIKPGGWESSFSPSDKVTTPQHHVIQITLQLGKGEEWAQPPPRALWNFLSTVVWHVPMVCKELDVMVGIPSLGTEVGDSQRLPS